MCLSLRNLAAVNVSCSMISVICRIMRNKMKNVNYAFFILCISISNLVFGQMKHYVLALSKAEHKLFVLDYKTLDTITKISVGEEPHGLVYKNEIMVHGAWLKS
jgi:hypothetical protein